MLTLDWFRPDNQSTPQQELHPGDWVPANPEPGPFNYRLRDAWEVLMGRAHAVQWRMMPRAKRNHRYPPMFGQEPREP
jgi:hypothetical protein